MTPIKGLVAIAPTLSATFAAADNPRAQALEAADAQIRAAQQALRNAEELQQRPAEPLPGERLGNVGGHSRLTPDYFARQRAMAAEVDAARARLDEAYRLRNQLRE